MSHLRKTAIIGLLYLAISGCASGWEEEERAAFKQSCVASAQMAGDGWPKETCDCLTQKLEASYPNPNDMVGLLDSLHTNPVLLFDKFPACKVPSFETPIVWTTDSEQAFMTSCNQAVKDGMVSNASTCPCVLDKVKRRFPTAQSMHKLNVEMVRNLAEECEGKRAPRLY